MGAPTLVLNKGCSLVCKQPGKALSRPHCLATRPPLSLCTHFPHLLCPFFLKFFSRLCFPFLYLPGDSIRAYCHVA